ncbi:unnamed protein product, partial [Pleuronectes platessa]
MLVTSLGFERDNTFLDLYEKNVKSSRRCSQSPAGGGSVWCCSQKKKRTEKKKKKKKNNRCFNEIWQLRNEPEYL